ncbi:MAG: hypothetical protein SCK57_03755 [Bacillota bacterium]|nr:hypothetical protein [Bacillota bacterium]MDW7676754.1 hypothetical protein [Bacillota bacterium]
MTIYHSLNDGFQAILKDLYGVESHVRNILLEQGFTNAEIDIVAMHADEFEKLLIDEMIDSIEKIENCGEYRSRIIRFIYCFQDNSQWDLQKEANERGLKVEGLRRLRRTTIDILRKDLPFDRMKRNMQVKAKQILNVTHVSR